MPEQPAAQRQETPLHVKIEQMLTEARVILPGAQALFGFQLSIVLTRAFEELPEASRLAHGVSLGFVAAAVMLLMAPAAYHRLVFAGEDREEMHRVGSIMVTLATLPLAIGLAGDLYVIVTKVAASSEVGIAAAGCALVMLFGLLVRLPSCGSGATAAEVSGLFEKKVSIQSLRRAAHLRRCPARVYRLFPRLWPRTAAFDGVGSEAI